MSYYVTSENSVLNINNAHLKVSGNIQTDVMKLGAIEFAPPASDVPGTVNFTNVTTGVTTSSNLNVGGTLMLGTVEVVGTPANTANLHDVVNLGNVTSNTVQFTNATTGIVATGNVEASKFIGDGSLLTGITTIESNVDLIRNTNNTAFINLNSNVVAEFPRSKKLIKYPRVALGTNASPYSGLGSGSTVSGYTIKASGEYDLNFLASKAFTGTNDANDVDAWLSISGAYSSNTPVANSATLAKFGQQGSWLEIKLPNKIKLSSTRIFSRRRHITERNDTADIWASNTGTDGDWVKLATINFNNTYTDTIPVVADIDTPTYYQYFAIQITRINWSGTYANIGEWELFGTPEYDPEAHGTDVTVKSVPNVPNTDWLEVYYDAKGLAVMPNPVPDETANNRDGVVTGASLDTTGGIESFAFNGVNQTITLSDVGISGGQALSMSGWLKVNSAGEVARMGIGTYTAARCMYFTVDNSISAYYIVCNAHNNVYTGTFTPNTWIHVNMVYTGAAYLGGYISGTTLLLYINGKLQTPSTPAAGTTPLNLPSPCPLRLGRGIDGGYTAGSIANFRLFNRALTSDEIYQLYAYQKEDFGHGDLSMTLKAGRLGIGTSEPRAALDVRGNIKCDTIKPIMYMLNDNRYLTPYFTGNGLLSTSPAVSGWHLAQLNNNYNLGLTNGYFWIKSPAMPNPLQMYVNFTADGGGYDFYRYTSATSVNQWHKDNGTRVLGLDLFYPRSKAHWAAIYDFVVNVNGSTISADVRVTGAVYSNSITLPVGATETYTDNYTTEKMRDPRYYGDGVPDWKVPDGGKWWLSDTTKTEPNGDYIFNSFLECSSVTSAGVVGFNDGNSNYSTGTTIICSTNVKGSSIPYF